MTEFIKSWVTVCSHKASGALVWLGCVLILCLSANTLAWEDLTGPRVVINPMPSVTSIDQARQWQDREVQGGTNDATWAWLDIEAASEPQYLIIPRGVTRVIDVYQAPDYLPSRLSHVERSMSGPHSLMLMQLPLHNSMEGASQRLYLQVQEGHLPPFVHVWTAEQYAGLGRYTDVVVIAMRSLMAFTILFAAFLWFKLRMPVFRAYALFITCSFLLYLSYMDGWVYHFPGLNISLDYMPLFYSAFGSCAYFFALTFVSLYTDIDRYVPACRRYLQILKVALLLVLAGLLLTMGDPALLALANVLWLLIAVSLWWMALLAWRSGSRYAGYVIIGWTPFVAVAIDMLAVAAGWKYGDLVNFVLFDSAVIFELVVFQFGLADMVLTFREERDKAASLAQRDALSGAYNRHGFEELLPGLLNSVAARDGKMALALFDIDHFKRINDDFGHDAGDACIREATQVIQAQLRESDLLVRYGGEEFLLLLPNITLAEAKEVCERIRNAIRGLTLEFEGQQIHFTTSVGLAAVNMDAAIEHTITCADKALYQSKEQGRDTLTLAQTAG
jgi:diguanylate cyclase (GGDEF)-like protein